MNNEELKPGALCGCRRCLDESKAEINGIPATSAMMILCAICGNKRCPHANDHRNVCTYSNEPGQPGSAYPRWPEVHGNAPISAPAAQPAQPASAPVTSIDTPEFIRMLDAWYLNSHNPAESYAALIAHIDAAMAAHGERMYRNGCADTLNGPVVNSWYERAEKAEAALARLVEGCSTLLQSLEAENRAGIMDAETALNARDILRALLPGKADKPKGCTGTPACCPDNEGYGCACTPTPGAGHA
jgi:hypothetical protein